MFFDGENDDWTLVSGVQYVISIRNLSILGKEKCLAQPQCRDSKASASTCYLAFSCKQFGQKPWMSHSETWAIIACDISKLQPRVPKDVKSINFLTLKSWCSRRRSKIRAAVAKKGEASPVETMQIIRHRNRMSNNSRWISVALLFFFFFFFDQVAKSKNTYVKKI